VEGNGGGRGGPPAKGADGVDGEVHGAVAKLEEAKTGPKDGRSGPSMWRRLAADGELVVEGPQQAGVGVTGGVRAVGEGVLGGAMLGVGSRWSERGWSRLSAVAQRRQERWCLERHKSGEAVEEEGKRGCSTVVCSLYSRQRRWKVAA
jgi:hypothetical protein